MQRVRIATRRSPLALAQAELVAASLRRVAPGLYTELLPMATRGDRDLSPSLAASGGPKGGKGAFIGALEEALADGRADVAVHSMKDVPAAQPEGMALVAFGARADARDALVARGDDGIRTLADLAPGTRVGTASIRRAALLAGLNRSVEVVPVRGNVETRLRRLDDGDVDALLLACAGLDRLGLGVRIAQRVAADALVPAPGQGAIAVEFVAGNRALAELVAGGVDGDVDRCVRAERQLTRCLGADCGMPLGAHCTVSGSDLRLVAVAADAAGELLLRAELVGADPAALGEAAARRLQALGVAELLAG